LDTLADTLEDMRSAPIAQDLLQHYTAPIPNHELHTDSGNVVVTYSELQCGSAHIATNELQGNDSVAQDTLQPGKRTKFTYPRDTKAMAVEMLRANPDITGPELDKAIRDHCGHGIGASNARRIVGKWGAK